ncbi:2-C-methyl-D-erythritol 2,4-cyclodiphosphate synthase [Hydrogenoanaerobacterium sp.]|uniref:2-C-methyl-D-erythritol 2,4-cyclodiphosphate synthase n=1 Tax=Hydrogenoanaerobacterium sp. TaxID=2953763 RepID=UPI0028965923|nr:2-C-methyl-D-erythritol 2,4-cyclodiphosphate synthase [Hydrogenoanaerobacterium sp.]
MRIGHGYDVHKLVPGRKLIIGGVEIVHETGLFGHSDADVLTHAVMDALLGAAALGDIGTHFPDTDDAFKGADSMILLRAVVDKLKKLGYAIANIDCTVIAQRPKLKDYLMQMRGNLADACEVLPGDVNIKATTEEKLGFTGREEGISAHAVCLLQPLPNR